MSIIDWTTSLATKLMSRLSDSTLKKMAQVTLLLDETSSDSSLVEFTSPARNVLMVTVEDRLTHNEVVENILKFSTNLYAGYYMQAVSMLGTVGNIQVREILDQLNTNRNLKGMYKANAQRAIIRRANESYDKLYALESFGKYPEFITGIPKGISVEAYNPYLDDYNKSPKFTPSLEALPDRDLALRTEESRHVLNDAPMLATGKTFDVCLTQGDQSITVPVTVLLSPVSCNRAMFTAMYAQANQNNTLVSRYKRWWHGELETVKDMIMVNDLIKEKASLLMKDKNKIVQALDKKRRENAATAVATGRASLATASTITVFSKETAYAIELAVGGKLENRKVRDYVFERSGLILMTIVDEQYEMVTIYHRGQDMKMELTFNECRFAAKGSGPNVMEVLRAFQSGQVPNI